MRKISRRNFLLNSTLSSFPFIYTSKKTQKNANLLLVILDDLNNYRPYLNCKLDFLTPHINLLKKQSINFESAYCQYPLCHPSRTSMLTGLHPFTNGVYMFEKIDENEFPVMPRVLKENNFFTVGIGKIFHPKYNVKDAWYYYMEIHDNLREFIKKDNDPLTSQFFCFGPVDIPTTETNDYKIVKHAIDFIKSKQKNPWFLAVGLHTPHTPLFTPLEFYKKIPKSIVKLPKILEEDLSDIPKSAIEVVTKYDEVNIHQLILERNCWEEVIYSYLLRIAFADELIGLLLKSLEETGELNNTCIILCGDNGWHLGEKKRWQKFTLWNEATKVPMIIHLPNNKKGGMVIKEAVGLIDIFPTITDICSITQPDKLEGKNLIPLIFNGESADENQNVVISQIEKNNFSFRTRRYCYIVYYDGSEELYDYKTDPLEWHNIASSEDSKNIKNLIISKIPQNMKEKIAKVIQKDIFL
ncbi:MAG TPA: sulfatase [Candidatus Hydrogenedens sp.]|nr:sulfatase [Candidatus Hydrogenedens sp.]